MCGRYALPEEPDELLQGVLDSLNRRPLKAPLRTSGDVHPSEAAPVLAPTRRGGAAPFAMRWGYVLPDGRRIINARSETAAGKPLFRDGLRQRRCVIPAARYYEWDRKGSRARYAIHRPDGALMGLAGLYRQAEGGPEFVVLTRAPSPSVAWLHDRMPVLLPTALWTDWLRPDCDPDRMLAAAWTDLACELSGNQQLRMQLDEPPIEYEEV